MTTNPKPAYQRILLKLSGEALQGSEGFGIDPTVLDRMAQEVKELVELGVQVGVVIGGGNLFRGAGLAKAGMNRVVGDHMGMLATVMNGLAMRDALHRAYVNARLMSAIPLNGVCDDYNWLMRFVNCAKVEWLFSLRVRAILSLLRIRLLVCVVLKLKLMSFSKRPKWMVFTALTR